MTVEGFTVDGSPFPKNEHMPFQFEKLKVWNEALRLAGEVAKLPKIFPKDELFVLTAQMKRAADSVVLNIAEGSTLQSKSEFKRFLVIANRSALEVVACFYLARERKLIPQEIFEKYYSEYENLIKSIKALIKSLI